MKFSDSTFFTNLDRKTKIDFVKAATKIETKKGNAVFLEGIETSSIYLIRKGWVRLQHYDSLGNSIILDCLGKGEILGITSLFSEERTGFCDVVTLEDSMFFQIKKKDLSILMQQDPQVGINLCRIMSDRAFKLKEQLKLRSIPGTTRVARALIYLSKNNPPSIFNHLRQKEVGYFCGLQRETVTKAYCYLRKKKIIDSAYRRLEILDFKKLKKIAEEELIDSKGQIS